MLNLISCELLKLKRSKMVLISVAGVLSTPLLMLIEALQTHFDKPEIIFTLSDIYSDSVLYIMPCFFGFYANPCNMGRYIYRLWAI